MSLLSEEVLQALICSVCKKYLSVFPVKVFPNKQVKCGRCCEEDDGGTTSRLYELVAKQFHFPCINRFEGCKEVLLTPKLKDHELSCNSNEFCCSLCYFNGSSYDLLHHMKISHKEVVLEDNSFLIDKDKGSSREKYFYYRNSFFVSVSYQYDADVQQLSLELLGTEQRNHQCVMHQFLLYSTENKLQYKTGKLETGSFRQESINIDISVHKYPKNIIVCKFQVWESAVMLSKYLSDQEHVNIQCDFPPVVDKSANKALLKFKFENVSKFEISLNNFSAAKYSVGDILWKLCIKKTKEDKEYLSVYLFQDQKKDLFQPCKMDCTITLISLTAPHKNYCGTFKNKKLTANRGWPYYLKWDTFINPENGYITNDSAYFDVLIEVSPPEEIKCDTCNVSMLCTECHR